MNERAIRKLMDQGYSYEDAYNLIYGEMPPEQTVINPDFTQDYIQSQSQFDNQDYGTLFAPRDFISSYKKEQRQFDLPGLNNTMTTGLNKSMSLNRLDKESWIEQQQDMSRNASYEELSKEYDEMFAGSNNTALDQFAAIAPFVNTAGMSTPSALYTSGRAFGAGETGLGFAGLGLAGLRGASNVLAGLGAQKRQDNTMDWYYQNLNRRNFESQPQYKDDATGLGFAKEGGIQGMINERKMSPMTRALSFEEGGELPMMNRYNFLRSLKDTNADFTVDMEDELEDLKEDLFPELFKAGGKKGGIPERYKSKGFSKIGVKKRAPEGAKHKWEVLAKKGDKYKIVKGGYRGMSDFTQHKDKDRQKRFWDRMGGKTSPKAKDPFSPLYWHKKFGTWEEGGEIEEDMAQQQAMSEQEAMTQEQQAMQDQEMVQEVGQEQAAMQQQQQILSMIAQALQQGATPEQVVELLVKNGIPEEQAAQMVQMIIQQMQGAQQMNYGGLFQSPSFYKYGGVEKYQDGRTIYDKVGNPLLTIAGQKEVFVKAPTDPRLRANSEWWNLYNQFNQTGRLSDRSSIPSYAITRDEQGNITSVNPPKTRYRLFDEPPSPGTVPTDDTFAFKKPISVNPPKTRYRLFEEPPSPGTVPTDDTFAFKKSITPRKMGGETFMGKGAGEKISFNYGGKKYNGTIDRVENGKLYLK
jgi:hypothetical protein